MDAGQGVFIGFATQPGNVAFDGAKNQSPSRAAHGVEPICKVLPIAPSTYHDHLAKRADPEKLSSRVRGLLER